MGGRCSGASWGLTLSLSTAAEGSGGAGGIRGRGGGVQGTGGGATEGFPLVGGTGWDTNGALFGEAGGKGGGGGGGGGGVGGGGAGTLGRGGTGLAELCASEALPSLGDAGAGRGPLMALVGSRGEGAREPGPCPVLPPATSLWPAGLNTGKPPAKRSPRAGGVFPPRALLPALPPSLLVAFELSICGALRSLIWVTFRRRFPCWMSANSALRPFRSVFLKLGASVLIGGPGGGGGGGAPRGGGGGGRGGGGGGGGGGGTGICHSIGISCLGMVPGE